MTSYITFPNSLVTYDVIGFFMTYARSHIRDYLLEKQVPFSDKARDVLWQFNNDVLWYCVVCILKMICSTDNA